MMSNTALRTNNPEGLAMLHEANVEGLAMLHEGKSQAARISFQRSIKNLLSVTTDNTETSQIMPITVVALNMDNIRPEYSIAPDNSFEIYAKGFHILEADQLSFLQQATITSALMYNMALTFHIEFVQTGSTRSLRSAGSVYRRALQTMRSGLDTKTEIMDSMFCVLLLAICNNLGHCLAHLFNRDSVNVCRQQIREVILRNWDFVEQDSCEHQEFSFFYSNLLFCSNDDVLTVLSPAA